MKYYIVITEILENGQPIDADALAFESYEAADKEFNKQVNHVENERRNYEITLTDTEAEEDEDPLDVVWNGYDPIKTYNNSFAGKLNVEVQRIGKSLVFITKELDTPYRTFQDWLYGNRVPPVYVQLDILSRIKKINPGD